MQIEHIFRAVQQLIDRHFEDEPRPVKLRKGESVEQKVERLHGLASYHADALGRLLSEISACLDGKLVQTKAALNHPYVADRGKFKGRTKTR